MSDYLEQEAILDTAMKETVRTELLELHTMLPATVTKFNAATQRVEIQLGVKRIYKNGQEIVVPPILDVPLGVLRGGGWVITLPVQVGDQGAAFFSEREIDQWMLAGHTAPQTPRQIRMHDYTDAYFLPALASASRTITNYSTTAMELRSLDGMVKQTFNSMSIVFRVGGVAMTLDSTGLHVENGVIRSNMDVIAGTTNISLAAHVHMSAAAGSPTSPPIPE